MLNSARCASALSIVVLLFAGLAPELRAHDVRENYVWLNIAKRHVEGRFEVNLKDLRQILGLEISKDYDAARAEVIANAAQVQAYLLEHFSIHAGDELIVLEFGKVDLLRSDPLGHFAQFHYKSPEFDIPDVIVIKNTLFFEGNESKLHRSLVCMEFNEKSGKVYSEAEEDPSKGETQRIEFTAAIFSPWNDEQELDLTDVTGLLRLRQFVWQGILHIWIGLDHILFLVCLLLPAVLILRGRREWDPVPTFKSAFWNILKIVTLFTIAHSISLVLAALDLVSLDSRWVESFIALSIVLMAANNLCPVVREQSWLVIIFFGLFHGLGFASVMGVLPFRVNNVNWVVFAFNVGVEIGQVVIVAAIFPIIFLLRRSPLYQPVVLRGGSIVIGLLALWWFIERFFEL